MLLPVVEYIALSLAQKTLPTSRPPETERYGAASAAQWRWRFAQA